jgi:hypothetical protein
MVWVFLVVGVSVARSMFQRAAGSQLLYGSALQTEGRLAGIKRYITFSLIHTAFVMLMMVAKWKVDTKIAVGVAMGLAVWPAALAIILAQPRFQRFRDDLPITEDKGFEGASILMTVLGLCGLIGGGATLIMMLQMPREVLQHGMTVIVVLATAMLVVRSAIHVQAGLAGLRETSVDRSVELANRYANFGIISSFCAAGALLMFFMQGRVEMSVFVLIVVVGWALMAWPLTIRRFFGDRQFAGLAADRLLRARGDAAHPAARRGRLQRGDDNAARRVRIALDLVARRRRRAAGLGRLRARAHEPAEPRDRHDLRRGRCGARAVHQLAAHRAAQALERLRAEQHHAADDDRVDRDHARAAGGDGAARQPQDRADRARALPREAARVANELALLCQDHRRLRPSRCGRLGTYVRCPLVAGFSPLLAALRACVTCLQPQPPSDPSRIARSRRALT